MTNWRQGGRENCKNCEKICHLMVSFSDQCDYLEAPRKFRSNVLLHHFGTSAEIPQLRRIRGFRESCAMWISIENPAPRKFRKVSSSAEISTLPLPLRPHSGAPRIKCVIAPWIRRWSSYSESGSAEAPKDSLGTEWFHKCWELQPFETPPSNSVQIQFPSIANCTSLRYLALVITESKFHGSLAFNGVLHLERWFI